MNKLPETDLSDIEWLDEYVYLHNLQPWNDDLEYAFMQEISLNMQNGALIGPARYEAYKSVFKTGLR